MSAERLLLAALLAPLAAAAAIALLGRAPGWRDAAMLAGAAALALLVAALAVATGEGARPALLAGSILPGLTVAFAVEPLGMVFALVASLLWAVNAVYAIGYMRANREPRQTSFHLLFAVAIAAALGIAFAANLFTLFLFYEVLTLSTYPLVAHKGTPEAMRGARTYLLMLLGTSILLFLPAIAITGVVAGSLDFRPGGVLAGTIGPLATGLLLALFVFGIGKAAMMPVHAWLPAAMVAPTPVSALLHAVAVVKAGVFAVAKIVVYTFGTGNLAATGAADWLVYVAGFTIVAASLVALLQDNLKRRLAWSTISQLSYVVLGAALLTPLALTGAALHIAGHALSKITLFFVAGALHTAPHLERVSELRGIGRRMPWTMGAFGIGALSMIGLPGAAGFLGKWFILGAAVSEGAWFAVAAIVLSTGLNAGYFLPVVYRAFQHPRPEDPAFSYQGGEAPAAMVAALLVTAAGTVLLFLLPGMVAGFAEAVGR